MTLAPNQLILLGAILAFGYYIFRLRTALADRLIYLVLGGAGIVLVLYPGLSTWVANRIGIGRGTDLLLYAFLVFSLFHYVSLVTHFRKIENQVTTIVRHIALAEASTGPANASSPSETGQARRIDLQL